MVKGVQRYISNDLDKKLQKIHQELKYNNRIKTKTFKKACDIAARRIQ